MVDSHHSYAADLSSPVMTAPRLGAALLPSSQCRPRAPSRASIPGAWIAPSVEILRLDMLGKDCAPYLAAAFAPVQARHRSSGSIRDQRPWSSTQPDLHHHRVALRASWLPIQSSNHRRFRRPFAGFRFLLDECFKRGFFFSNDWANSMSDWIIGSGGKYRANASANCKIL